MIPLDRQSAFWSYLSDGQKGLIEEGMYLLEDMVSHRDARITDYSFLVFPFSKAYEGFLKQLFLDLGFISLSEYSGHRFRIGRALNPFLETRLRTFSVYDKIAAHCGGRALADRLWDMWKQGRNLVFHYFPHNIKALTYEEAEYRIAGILTVMNDAVSACRIPPRVTR